MAPNPVLQRLVDERTQANANIDSILDSANEEERDPTEAERQLITRHRERLAALEPQIGELLDLEEQRGASRDARAALTRGAPDDDPTPGLTRTAPDAPNVDVYSHFGQMARDEILVRFDKIAARAPLGAREQAAERLQRAVANTVSGDLPGIIPKQHLAQIIDVINRNRPVVDSARMIGLTSGTLTYPKITSRPIVGKQGGEKTELPSQKMAVALQQATADTFGGAGDLSWQSVVWSNPDALNLWFELAAEAYARATETETCTDLFAAVTQTQALATDDLAGWMAAIAAAAGVVYANSGHRADTLYVNIALGYHLLGMVAGVAPVFISAGGGSLQSGQGTVAGLRLVMSPGFAAKTAIVGDSQALLVGENAGAPVELRVVEPSIAGFEVGVVGAFVDVVTEPNAFVKMTGAAIPLGEAEETKAAK